MRANDHATRRRTGIAGVLLAGLPMALCACGAETTSHADPQPAVTVTATATVTPQATKDAPAPTRTPTKAPRPKLKPKPSKPKVYLMPNEVGNVLQSAQEDIEGILGVPFWPLLRSHDVKYGLRFQVLDRDWKVCDQKPAAGQSFTDGTVIDFGVVKLDERCP